MTSSPIPTRPSRRLLGTALAAGLLLTAYGGGDSGSAGGGEGAQAGGTLTFATGGTGGVYYPYGGGIANLLSSQLDGTVVTVQETNASVDNMQLLASGQADRKSTRLNSSHANISYAVFCLKKKNMY